ncbi:MAG: glutamate synthase subunit alpha, partial [Acidobacteria bacterium]|nr:glutamate synthase subunit alpha [Acidobacteriota bacterium]
MDDDCRQNGLPEAQGLYSPEFEHDACGIGFVVNIKGERSHDIITKGIQILINLSHRGACGCDPETGDGAGILIQIPHLFFQKECARLGMTLPPPGEYAVGMCFLPVEPQERLQAEGILERIVREEGLSVIGWRDTPVNAGAIGRIARRSQPYIEQIFIRHAPGMGEEEFERKLFIIRKRTENEIAASDLQDKAFFYIPSLSCRTIIYKGLLLAPQMAEFYGELSDPDTMSALCLVHQRFSTNTFPTWQLAHPFRYLCHNGEINTVRGNTNWMTARQPILSSPAFGDMKRLFPIITPNVSDSSSLDQAVELLFMAGRELPHVIAMLIPEAWDADSTMHPDKRAFYEYHASLMEPWDGPAAVAFTDGRVIGATLDRNGLRPARYLLTHSDMLIMASETGVLPVKEEEVRYKGRLQPGRMLLADTVEGRIIPDEELKERLYKRRPYAAWLEENQITLDTLPEPPRVYEGDLATLLP